MFLEKRARKQIDSIDDENMRKILVALHELQGGFQARLDIKK